MNFELKAPRRIDGRVEAIAERISTDHPSITFVDVIPEEYSEVNNCFFNVPEKIHRDGGKEIYGWQIWCSHFFIEAEFHVIWQSDNGSKLIDITPKNKPISKIMFIKDSDKKFEGFQVNNIRINTSGNPLVDDYFKIFDAQHLLRNKDELKEKFGEITITGRDAAIYSFLDEMKVFISFAALSISSQDEYCPCGSNLSYNDCHRKELLLAIEEIS